MEKKGKILCWADAPVVSTGFGKVSKYTLRSLHKAGFEIDVLGVNYFGQFYDQEEFPYQISPAKLLDPSDPYGNSMLLRTIKERGESYDFLFIINDVHVTHRVAKELRAVVNSLKRPPTVIFYYPVDCRVLREMSDLLQLCDVPVAQTLYGQQETLKVYPGLGEKSLIIPHGVDIQAIFPFSQEEKRRCRKQYFGVEDDKTFVFINVNRNSLRKDLAKTVLAFAEFKKHYPNSKLYLHTKVRDQMLDLKPAIQELPHEVAKDCIFPVNYSPAAGVPEEVLNELYNASDCFVTTTLGEGYGLSTLEAMAAGIPVVGPANTSFLEIVGINQENPHLSKRGILYPCKEKVYIDNSGARPLGQLEDIYLAMQDAYTMRGTAWHTQMLDQALQYAQEHSWDAIGELWVRLFTGLLEKRAREAEAQASQVGKSIAAEAV